MKFYKLILIILLFAQILGADKNKLDFQMILKPCLKKLEKNILSLESRNIGIYGFDIKNNDKNFNIDKFFKSFIETLENDLRKIKDFDLIDIEDLIDADNKLNIFNFKGMKYREKIKEFFQEVDMDLMLTGEIVYSDNQLNIILKYIDKKRLMDIIILNKNIKKKEFLEFYLKDMEVQLNSTNYIFPRVKKDSVEFIYYDKNAKNVKIGFTDSREQGVKKERKQDLTPIPMKKDSNGFWMVKLKLEPGRYRYKFIVDGVERFDPKNPNKEDDGYAGIVSVLIIKD